MAPNLCIQVKFVLECVNIDINFSFACSADFLWVRAKVVSSRSFIRPAMFYFELEWTVGVGGRRKGQKTPARRQGCALAAPGRLRRLTFGLGRLKKKGGRPSGRIDFGLCENPKRNQQTYRNGTERNKKKLHRAPRLPLARKAKALKAQCNQ